MVQPINYNINVPTGAQALNQALQTAGGIQSLKANQMQMQQAQQQMDQQKQQSNLFGEELASLGDNPAAGDIVKLMTKFPDLSTKLKSSYDILNSEQKENKIANASQVYAALTNSKTDIAKSLIQNQLDAATNSGDEKEAKAAQMMLGMVDADPAMAKQMFAMSLSSLMGADNFLDTFSGLEKAEAERKLAPGELAKQAADLGLTKAETAKTLAEVKKLDGETKRAVIEAEALKKSGGITKEKTFDLEKKLREEYTKGSGNYVDVVEAYRRLDSAENTGAGDLSLIFSFMKMLDPGSTVREGEFANAENTGGVSVKVRNLYNKVSSGERLTDEQRKSFNSQARGLLAAAEKREKEVRGGLSKIAENYSLNKENIFVGKPSGETGQQATQEPQQMTAQDLSSMTDDQLMQLRQQMQTQ